MCIVKMGTARLRTQCLRPVGGLAKPSPGESQRDSKVFLWSLRMFIEFAETVRNNSFPTQRRLLLLRLANPAPPFQLFILTPPPCLSMCTNPASLFMYMY